MRHSRLISRAAAARACFFPLVALAALTYGTGALASLSPNLRPDEQAPAQTQADFVRLLPLQANDVIYNPADKMLYASVPSSAGASGNSIAPINPATGEVGTPVFVGSEPDRLAMSDDGRTLYVSLDGAFSVRRFDTQTRTPGAQTPLGVSAITGIYGASDMAVAPGNPNRLAVVSRHFTITSAPAVAVFDNGAQLPQIVTDQIVTDRIVSVDGIAFSPNNASKLYGGGGQLTMTIGESGLVSTAHVNGGVGARIKYDNGLIYGSAGMVMNPDTGLLLGTFAGAGAFGAGASPAFAPDSQAGRVYYLRRDSSFDGGPLTLHAYDINTYLQVGTMTINGVTGIPTTLVRWGSNGLAFTTTTGQLCLVQTSLIPSGDPVPTATPSVSPTPTPQPTVFPATIRRVFMPANDIVLDPSGQTLYGSVPFGNNSITAVDLATGVIGASTFIGSQPGKMSLADDGRTLYVNLEGAQAVRRFDIQTKTPGLQFPVGVDRLGDLEAVPGSPRSVAVARGETLNGGVAIFDDGVERPSVKIGIDGSGSIEFGSLPSLLYGFDSATSSYPLVKYEVTPSAIKQIYSLNGVLSGFENSMKFAGGRLYSGGGRVADPEAKAVVGTFGGGGGDAVAVDAAAGRVYFLQSGEFVGPSQIIAYDINTFLPVGSIALPALGGRPITLLRWGADGLAFCTRARPNDSTSFGAIYLVQSPLVSSGATSRSTFRLSAGAYSPVEGSNLVVTVTRAGGVSSPAMVNYATLGGTATPGSDYAPASGTLLFAAGETAKSFTVPLPDDAVYEGVKTFGLALSSPSGDSLLGDPSSAVVAIQDSKAFPTVTGDALSILEGDSGTTNADFTVRLSVPTTKTVTVQYKTTDGTALAGSDYVAASGTLTFAPGETTKTIPLQIVGDRVIESDETFYVDFPAVTNADTFGRGFVTIVDDDRPRIQFTSANFVANEGDGRAQITVRRFGPNDTSASVNYSTVDDTRPVRCDDLITAPGVAFARCDYATVVGTLTFAPGETVKSFTVPLVDDGYAEPAESVRLRLSAPAGTNLGTPSTATLTIIDNDTPGQPNPLNSADFFVRMQYLDFLSREPEAGQPWSGVINNCPAGDASCDRISVSANFFRSDEFQLKGLFVFKFYKVSFGRLPTYAEIVSDMSSVTGSTTAELVAKKAAFAAAFAQRPEFANLYGGMTSQQLVDALLGRYNLQSITTINPASPDDTTAPRVVLTRADLVSRLTAGTLTRGQVVRALADSNEVSGAEFNPAFVAMQYYGYLRRDPEPSGYQAWLQTINANPSDFRAMVNGFMNSTEYRLRFGQP